MRGELYRYLGMSLPGGRKSKPEFGGTRLAGFKDFKEISMAGEQRSQEGGAVTEGRRAALWRGDFSH